ncbi:histidinol-phosphate transaminase [Campylobacter sp.]|uniref:pyridoxal phosphate-dependent aminotransferase n=1 Tax=Campylobacter sp. TaxID=205 RepID=UPI0026DB0C65|nr:histidinol-phosphate transaminase [Campylobacter sp.]MDO4674678.1 histidinol-phosphate transaminase [Campylobacter sp.]
MQGNRHLQSLKPYLSIPHKIWERSLDEGVLKLDWNEATIPPSPKVYEALDAFLKEGRLSWYPNTKPTALLEQLAAYTQQESIDFITLFAGSDAAHEGIIDSFLEKDHRIGIVSPSYDHFRARANGVGLKTLHFSLDENFDLDFEALSAFLSEEAIKLLYLCNPNNPTGKAYCTEKIKKLIQKHPRILFLIDEAYFEFCGLTLAHLCKDHTNLILTRTFSKAFALASFRIGYVISHPENIRTLNKLRNPKSIPALSQIAAEAALKDYAYMQNYVAEVSLARADFINFLDDLSLEGGGGGG